MIYSHPAHAGRRVRLAYCQNVHAANDLDAMLTNMRAVTLPLRDRLAPDQPFGVGLYLSGALAAALAKKTGDGAVSPLSVFLESNKLEAFTFNAFPHQGFHQDGLKADVFKPTWKERERVEFTLDVARAAVKITPRARSMQSKEHVSISTHTGMFGAWVKGAADLEECMVQIARVVDDLARMEEESGVRIVLALEPEPRANASDGAELLAFFEASSKAALQVLEEERNRESTRAKELLRRHLGWCLDTCHSAVEFERDPLAALPALTLGKVQYANAIEVRSPAANLSAVAALMALDEPRYLHQVVGHQAGAAEWAGVGVRPRVGQSARRMQAADIAVLRAELDTAARADWMACDAWRCHYHVPVDLEAAGSDLGTTRAVADEILTQLVMDPSRWSTNDLHLEIETYTWDVLPGHVRGHGGIVDGLEREYRHVMAVLEGAGWRLSV